MSYQTNPEILSGAEINQITTQKIRYYIMSGKAGEWLIYREGTMNPVQSVHKKSEALARAKALARIDKPAEILVEQRDGTFKTVLPSGTRAREGMRLSWR
ncbi:MAG TPA: DUF2188 domain-containing protein [Verrucomicrobiae bacterium]|jgi:hypothetical protein